MLVEVAEGKLKGVEKVSKWTGREYCAFTSIPYAEPPIGELRFKPPVPIKKWEGVLDATEEADPCIQFNEMGILVGTEDCLYLNVYTPKAPSKMITKRAVMVYIHGGGYFCKGACARYCGPDYLVDRDIILVTLNYRLHVLGFLNTGTSECPGNAGLKDQLLALKWVKKNIESFGGDSNNITIFGESAGASSVHLHMISPLSKGLFHRAIVQNGTAFAPWALEVNPSSRAHKIARLAGYDGEVVDEMVEYLRNQSARKLCELANRCHEDAKHETMGRCSTVVFIPSVELIADGAFLPDLPEKLMKTAQPIPTIFGFADQEGLLIYGSQKKGFIESALANPLAMLTSNFNLDKRDQIELLSKIREFHFKNERPGNAAQVVNIYTDLYFIKFYEALDYLINSNHPPYVYLFTYEGTLNSFKKKFCDANIKGAGHADELEYIFTQDRGTSLVSTPNGADKNVINNLCNLWTNFAKNGNPTATITDTPWKPHTKSHPCYLKIDRNLDVVDEKLFEERFNFWKKWLVKLRP